VLTLQTSQDTLQGTHALLATLAGRHSMVRSMFTHLMGTYTLTTHVDREFALSGKRRSGVGVQKKVLHDPW
jgi:hypothetical protein